MPVIGNAEILISPVFKDLQKKIGQELDGIGPNEGKKAGSGFGKAVGVAAVAAVGIAAGGIGIALTKGFGRLQAIENARAKLTGLGHSTEAVQGIMNNALAAVKGTAFGLDEAASVAAGAVAAGIKPGEELEKTLRLTGDAATIAGVGMGEMGAIFNKVASSNKIQGDVIAQLNDAGIPIVQLLGKELGTTAEETLKLASDGKVNFETFQKAMESGLGGAALESGRTLQGAFKNTMAAVGRIGANLLSGVYPKIQEFFTGAIGWLAPLEEGAKIAGAAIGTFLSDGLSAVKGISDILFKGDYTGGIFGLEEDHPFIDFLFNLREGFQKLSGLLTGSAAILFNGEFAGAGIMGMEEDSTLVSFLFGVRDAFLSISSFVSTDLLPALSSIGSYIVTDLVPGLLALLGWMNENGEMVAFIAAVIGVLLLPALVRLAVGAMVSAATQVIAWVMTQAAAIKTGVVYVVQSFVIIGRWIAMAAAAVISGAQTVAIWALYKLEAIKGAIAYGIQSAYVIGAWVAMSAAAVASGIKTAAVWVGTVVASAATGAASFAISAARVIGGWALMGVQSLIHAGRMALAWFIAMGPIGWVIAAVIGLVAIVIANWDTISRWTKEMWERHVKPVFDNLANFISKDVPDAFNRGIEFIGKAWEKLKAIVRAPIDFVINQVVNKGLIDGLNAIGGFLQLPQIPHVPQLPQFSEGGYTGPGGKYDPAGIVHAGEIVWSQDDISRWGGVGIVESLRRAAGYAKGGLVHPLRQSVVSQPFHGGHNGIDFAAPTGTPIGAAGPGRVSSAGWSSYGGGNEIHIDHPNGLQTWYAHLSSFAVKLGDMVRGGSKIGEVGSTGNSTGPHLHYMVMNGGWPNFKDPSPYLEGGGEGGWNPISGIIDGLLASFKDAFPAAGFVADMAIGVGKKLLDGAVDFIMGNGGKDDGIGSTGLPYLHDNGGYLNPGLSSIVNATRKPEAILNAQQWADIHRLATGSGATRDRVANVTINQVDDPIGTSYAVQRRLGALAV